ncbi:putative E3 ubiquitin-protein ligase HIP1 isoform X2 [Gossypium australe]|uniref:RING-type E3 ubiquitin transferase n=1 Tax=Gossypium australe TaxID=47621 RepID=A0A5B6W4C4_9ROSI|nr:putative E3 ubiquitin-protein ligase HIP1 isoform X2 [Gossypium australe]
MVQIRNVLDLMRRGENLRFELPFFKFGLLRAMDCHFVGPQVLFTDKNLLVTRQDVVILDQSAFFGVGDIHDRHRDMRLDVDNMSYEELLALEERIGNVNTGLSEEMISNQLKRRKYSSVPGTQLETEPCCVCQEEYTNGEDLGTLECGHDFHADCIKQWLMHKNLCPICKTTVLEFSFFMYGSSAHWRHKLLNLSLHFEVTCMAFCSFCHCIKHKFTKLFLSWRWSIATYGALDSTPPHPITPLPPPTPTK